MIFTIISAGLSMVNKLQPYTLTEEIIADAEDWDKKIFLKDLNSFPFGFTELGSWPALTMKDIEPYIELRAV